VEINGKTIVTEAGTAPPKGTVIEAGGEWVLFADGSGWSVAEPSANQLAGEGASDGMLLAPMPGRIIRVDVNQGDTVSKGQKLLVLEAMKMEHALIAPFDGSVSELKAVEGAQVAEGTLLARIERGDG